MKLNLLLAAVILNVCVQIFCAEKDLNIPLSICSTSNIHLDDKGITSSVTISLVPSQGEIITPPKQCRIHITAPDTHLIYVRLVDDEQEKDILFQQQQEAILPEREFEGSEKIQAGRKVHSKRNGVNSHGCPINVYQSETTSTESTSSAVTSSDHSHTWSTNACDISVPTEGSLFSNDVHITWIPPITAPTKASRERNLRLQNRKLVVTALGKGDRCHSKDQHICIQVSWTPLLCVAEELLCDGVVHCPPGGLLGDENPQFCKDRNILTATNWERLATEFLKKFSGKAKPGSLIPAIQKDNNKWSDNWKSTEISTFNYDDLGSSNKNSTPIQDSPNNLTNYGPWGYLMLGMLICGTVLIFCGLWECCCKRSKPHHQHLESTPTASTIAGTMIPTAILVLGADTERSSPPRYEDLDQPPSYNALFPEQKEAEAAASQEQTRDYSLDIPSEEVNS